MPTALIVEDEPEANHLLSMLIQLRGYRTDSAFTGNEALEKVREQPPDIVFLDLMLPDINGYEVCEGIKGRKTTSLIPVVMVTARIAAENRLQSFRAGANDYIPKPYTPDQIYQAMDQADAWRRTLENPASEGRIALNASCDGDALRSVALLRSLLVASGWMSSTDIANTTAALVEIAADADAWGFARSLVQVATLDYRIQPNLLSITLRDLAGWLNGELAQPESRWPKFVPTVRWDSIETDSAAKTLTFTKRLEGSEKTDSA